LLLSLDFLYTPSDDVDRAVDSCVDALGAVLVWRIAAMGTLVAAVRVSAVGPLLLFADHLEAQTVIAIYRVAELSEALAAVTAIGAGEVREMEIPPGPCATFSLAGVRLGIYEHTRPGAQARLASWAGR
jgi:hypothetical protein